jgi:hypothetical protein
MTALNGRPTNAGHPPPGDGTFTLLTFDDLMSEPDLRWMIDGIAPEGFAVMYGAPGSFKSFLALDWALCVATGRPWHGHAVEPGYVVYVAAEGRGGLKQRVWAWWTANGRPDMSRIRWLPEWVNLLDPAQVAKTRASLATLPERAALLVVDTMARSMTGGDENSAKDVGTFVAAVDGLRQARSSLVVHHTGHDTSRARGSTALRGAADLMVKVERDKDSPRLTVTCDKPKDFEPWEAITLRRGIVDGSCVLSLVETAPARDDLRERVFAYIAANGPVSQRKVEAGVGGNQNAAREAVRGLAASGLIVRPGPTGWVPVERARLDQPDAVGRALVSAPPEAPRLDGGKGPEALPERTRRGAAVRVPRPEDADAPESAITGDGSGEQEALFARRSADDSARRSPYDPIEEDA